MSADSYVMYYFKGKYTTLFCKCIRTKKKSYKGVLCPLIESKHRASVFHFNLYLHPFIGSKHKDEVPLTFLSLLSLSPCYNTLITNRLCKVLKVTANEKQKNMVLE